MPNPLELEISRRGVLVAGAATAVTASLPALAADKASAVEREITTLPMALEVNGEHRELVLDARTTLLDALREHLHLTGTKKGCDHGQCGACTVLVNGVRINSCLSLAVMHANDSVVTIEGLGTRSTFIRCKLPLSSMMVISAATSVAAEPTRTFLKL
jgi:xanthine dehydrogenase YagT iron-sulfur-binding subunit